MDDPLQTGKIETGEIETMASRVAAMNNAASNPQVDGGGVPQGDEYESPDMYDPGAAGGGLEGYHFYFADETELFIATATVFEDYDGEANWAIVIPVSGDSFNTAGEITYDAGAARYDGDASTETAQTYYRVHVVRDERVQSLGGSFEEDGYCAGNKGPIVRMLKLT